VEHLPLLAEGAPALLVRAIPVEAPPAVAAQPLPERLLALRERAAARFGADLLAGPSAQLRLLARRARLAARSEGPVALVGPAGSGKEALARFIHYSGPHRELSFAALDCARLPPAALARLHFGEHEAGLRTALGALYLRDASRLPRDLQLCLLEWLEGRPEGATPRLFVGLTAAPLDEVRAGRLIEGLAEVLGALVLEVPPLRDRLEHLPALVERLLPRASLPDEGPSVAAVAPAVLEVLRRHDWPGNVHELLDVLATACAHARGERLEADHLPASLRLPHAVAQAPGRAAPRPVPLGPTLERVERRLIELALRRAGGNRTRAAELLDVWRPKLLRRMEALKIEPAGPETAEGG
jgi:DNA-binding NtrC family response regulator